MKLDSLFADWDHQQAHKSTDKCAKIGFRKSFERFQATTTTPLRYLVRPEDKELPFHTQRETETPLITLRHWSCNQPCGLKPLTAALITTAGVEFQPQKIRQCRSAVQPALISSLKQQENIVRKKFLASWLKFRRPNIFADCWRVLLRRK